MSKLIGKSHVGLLPNLERLEEEKILESKTEGKNKYFTLNFGNLKTKSLILQSEIYATDLFLEKNSQFKLFLKSVNPSALIILFGSFAKGSTNKNSDVDLLTISEKNIELPMHLISNKMHRINLREKSFLKSLKENEPVIKEVEENHIILNGHSYYVNLLWNFYGK